MERDEDAVRVWTGMSPLQAKFMEQLLLDNGIECFTSHNTEMLPAGGFFYAALWVARKDEQRARALLEDAENTMSEQLNAELPDEESETKE